MGKIKKLDHLLSNKIAAGEVVERPASIVKELVENSIDAHSTRIEIEVEDGGLARIRIIDNGDGIEYEDIMIAFQRHATSKIQNENDLFHIRTLGFRGEALPSIASVSKINLETSTGKGPGHRLLLQYGNRLERTNTASRKGTDIEVTQLFHNTPARLKHLKTVHTELGKITDVINRQAMAYPSIAFHLKHNGRTVLKTPGNGDLLHVIAAIYGKSVAKKMMPIKQKTLDYTIQGYAVKPEITRATRQYLSLFINGRYIKNYAVHQAIEQAYHTFLPIGRQPIVILLVELDPILVDVNVHPAKLEARFSKERELTKAVEKGIRDALGQTELIPDGVPQQKVSKLKNTQSTLHFEPQSVFKDTDEERSNHVVKKEVDAILSDPSFSEFEDDENPDDISQKQGETGAHPANESQKKRVPSMYPVGQVHGTYIVTQNEQGMYIIDQHAAQERIKYEYYKEKVGECQHELQELLIPLTFEFTHTEKNIIEVHMGELTSMGIFLEPFGGNGFIVRSHPQWFPKGKEQDTIQAIIEQVLADRKTSITKLREDTAIMMSCKGSIKANRYLRQDEMTSLIETLRNTKNPFTCPHGRPIIIQFTTYEMEKMFKRVM